MSWFDAFVPGNQSTSFYLKEQSGLARQSLQHALELFRDEGQASGIDEIISQTFALTDYAQSENWQSLLITVNDWMVSIPNFYEDAYRIGANQSVPFFNDAERYLRNVLQLLRNNGFPSVFPMTINQLIRNRRPTHRH